LEPHPLGSQLFLPLGFARFVIVLAPAGRSGEPDDIFAFVTDGRQGVNYRAGVWHHPLTQTRLGRLWRVVNGSHTR
jgi:ureidoglycolate lyase